MHRDIMGWDCVKATNDVIWRAGIPRKQVYRSQKMAFNSQQRLGLFSRYHVGSRLTWNVLYPHAYLTTDLLYLF